MKYFPPKFYHQKGVQFICAFSLCAGDIYDHFNVLLSLIYLFEQEKFEVIIRASRAFSDDTGGVEKLWKDCGDAIYSLEPRLRSLGLGSEVCLSPLTGHLIECVGKNMSNYVEIYCGVDTALIK